MIPYIREVRVSNYKSMARVATTLEPFTLLVGPNGAGKSNFIDCLAFVQECLSGSVEEAIRSRGGMHALTFGGGIGDLGPAYGRGELDAAQRRDIQLPPIAVRLVIDLGNGVVADYQFKIAKEINHRSRVDREQCEVRDARGGRNWFSVQEGGFLKEIPGIRPQLPPDRLALFAASATDEFRPLYDFLTSMRFYSILPSSLRELQESDSGRFLRRDGSNAAAVLKRLMEDPELRDRYERVCGLLGVVAEGIKKVEYRPAGSKETLLFTEETGQGRTLEFEPRSMSDGTLRVLGLLLAAYQPDRPSVLGIEEPEATVHPAVAEVVAEVLLDAAHDQQVLVTTYSPDILDYKELKDEQIRAVAKEEGQTLICPVSDAARVAIRKGLYTPGELLRIDELRPDLETALRASSGPDTFSPAAHDGDERA